MPTILVLSCGVGDLPSSARVSTGKSCERSNIFIRRLLPSDFSLVHTSSLKQVHYIRFYIHHVLFAFPLQSFSNIIAITYLHSFKMISPVRTFGLVAGLLVASTVAGPVAARDVEVVPALQKRDIQLGSFSLATSYENDVLFKILRPH
jgi:hypothetical protein